MCIFYYAAGFRYKPNGSVYTFVPTALHQNLINLKRTQTLILIKLDKYLVVDSYSEFLYSSKNEQSNRMGKSHRHISRQRGQAPRQESADCEIRRGQLRVRVQPHRGPLWEGRGGGPGGGLRDVRGSWGQVFILWSFVCLFTDVSSAFLHVVSNSQFSNIF